MHESSLPEIPERITTCVTLEFAEWLNKFAQLKHLPNWPQQLSLGETSAKSLLRSIQHTKSCTPLLLLAETQDLSQHLMCCEQDDHFAHPMYLSLVVYLFC